jgi:hypothetical protein
LSGSSYHLPDVLLAGFCQLLPVAGSDSGCYQPGIKHFNRESQRQERGPPSGLVRNTTDLRLIGPQ